MVLEATALLPLVCANFFAHSEDWFTSISLFSRRQGLATFKCINRIMSRLIKIEVISHVVTTS